MAYLLFDWMGRQKKELARRIGRIHGISKSLVKGGYHDYYYYYYYYYYYCAHALVFVCWVLMTELEDVTAELQDSKIELKHKNQGGS